jgi:oligoribonuclease (3'-5' exoribonuclease)
MKRFLSLDIETTGLDERDCQILEFGAVVGDFSDTPILELPSFQMRFKWPKLMGDPYALQLNHELIRDMAFNKGEWHLLEELAGKFRSWLLSQGYLLWANGKKITVTGKNIGSFDRRFLNLVPDWDWNFYSHRYLDPGSLWFNPARDDELPNTQECAKRAGIVVGKLHDAVEDSRLVVAMLRSYYRGNHNVLPRS